MKDCVDCVFYQSCCSYCSALGSFSSDPNACGYFLTVESAKYYATVRNGIYTALGDPIEFGRKVGKALKDASEKNIELHDKT